MTNKLDLVLERTIDAPVDLVPAGDLIVGAP